MRVYSVYLGDVYLKCFDKKCEATALYAGLNFLLISNGVDIGLVKIIEEDV